MKVPHFLSSIFFFIFSFNCCFSQTVRQKKLYMESTDFNTLTTIRVTCIEFEENFAGRIKVKEIEGADTIQRLDFFLQKIKYSRKNEDIDARAKFIYDKGNDIKVRICISKFDIIIDGRLTKQNKEFLGFLRNLTR